MFSQLHILDSKNATAHSTATENPGKQRAKAARMLAAPMALHLAIDGKTNEGFKEKNAAANLCDPPFKVKMKSRHLKQT